MVVPLLGRHLRNILRSSLRSRYLCSGQSHSNEVIVESVDDIALIGINRPEKRNCVNISTAESLIKAFVDFDGDDSSKVAVLYGVGGNFCSGYDLQEISEHGVEHIKDAMNVRSPMGPTGYETKKPVIAAIDGYAVAGGLELALWCDIRVVDETAIMGVFCRRFGVPLIDGGTFRLPALIGLSRAMDLILTGRPISAQEALDWGLANRIVSCGTALGNAIQYAKCLTKFPQDCLILDRLGARKSLFYTSSAEALQRERQDGQKYLSESRIVEEATKFMDGIGKKGSFKLHDVKLQQPQSPLV